MSVLCRRIVAQLVVIMCIGTSVLLFSLDPNRSRPERLGAYRILCSTHFVTGTKSNNQIMFLLYSGICQVLSNESWKAKYLITREGKWLREGGLKKYLDRNWLRKLKDEEERRNRLKEGGEHERLKKIERERCIAEIEKMKSEEIRSKKSKRITGTAS